MLAIEVNRARKDYGSGDNCIAVLQGLNLKMKANSIYALIGASGVGKSTLLSCIVGSNNLDEGYIKVFSKSNLKMRPHIGFMPQESALVNNFTLREMMNFFGMIHGMKSNQIRSQIKFLSELLELPEEDKLIGTCSGGEQRRISFAITMIHGPKILILDEPMVGLDPLLRNKIWDFLKTSVKTQNLTVMLSTHYIDEAKHASQVGMMRNGVLLAESDPVKILDEFRATSLEEVFLNLCMKQQTLCAIQGVGLDEEQEVQPTECDDEFLKNNSSERSENSHGFSSNRIKAFLNKNITLLLRSPLALFFFIASPLYGILSLNYTIGASPIGLKLGIVNYETSYEYCNDPDLVTTYVHDFICDLNKVSCRFIQQLHDDVAIKIFYDKHEDAYHDAKHGKLSGYIQFSSNFTQSLTLFKDDASDDWTDNGIIQVHLDQTDSQLTYFLKSKLYNVYHNFIEQLMLDCGKAKYAGSMPIKFEALYGKMDEEFKKYMATGLVIAFYFFIASLITSTAILADRVDGIWNRTIISGAKPLEILLSQIISASVIMIFQGVQYFLLLVYIFREEDKSNSSLVGLLLLLVGTAAILYGIGISVISKTFMMATFLSSLVFVPIMSFSGMIWPLEAVPESYRFIGYWLPFTLPSITLRNLLYKGLPMSHPSIYTGFIILGIWNLMSFALCYIGIKRKKYVN